MWNGNYFPHKKDIPESFKKLNQGASSSRFAWSEPRVIFPQIPRWDQKKKNIPDSQEKGGETYSNLCATSGYLSEGHFVVVRIDYGGMKGLTRDWKEKPVMRDAVVRGRSCGQHFIMPGGREEEPWSMQGRIKSQKWMELMMVNSMPFRRYGPLLRAVGTQSRGFT